MTAQQALSERLDFMQLDAEAVRNLQAVKQHVDQALPEALDRFYGQVRRFEQTRRFFTDEGHLAKAKGRQVGHWDAISSGRFDAGYMRAVTTIGQVHAQIGLEPRWYIGGYALVLEELLGAVLAKRWPKAGLGASRGPTPRQVGAELGAIAKATLLDMDIAISVYLAAAEEARLKAEAEVLARERATVVRSVGEAMAALARGDLTCRLTNDLPAEYAQLRDDFNAAVEQMRATLSGIASATEGLRTGSDEIAAASDDLSRRTEQQAASLEETAAALEEITATVKRGADGARQAAAAAGAARGDAEHSGEIVREAVSAMGQIEGSSSQITRIIGVIDEIAFQTNLLALNAGVEAARAGEAGRGFAVVAQEVRALAQRSAEAAKEIKGLISSSSEQVARGVKLVGDTGAALEGIVARVVEIDGLIGGIAASSQEQATGLSQVNVAVNQMDQVTQQNAAMVEEATAAAAGLRGQAQDLAALVGQFELGGERVAEAVMPVSAARPASREAKPAPQPRLRAIGGGGWEEF